MRKVLLLIITLFLISSCKEYRPYYVFDEQADVYGEGLENIVARLNNGDEVIVHEKNWWHGDYREIIVNGESRYVLSRAIRQAPVNAQGKFNWEAFQRDRSDSKMSLIYFFIITVLPVVVLAIYGKYVKKAESRKLGIILILLYVALSVYFIHYSIHEHYQTWFCHPEMVGFWWSLLTFALFTVTLCAFFVISMAAIPMILCDLCNVEDDPKGDPNYSFYEAVSINMFLLPFALILWLIVVAIWDCRGTAIIIGVALYQLYLFVVGMGESRNKFAFFMLFVCYLIVASGFTLMLYFYIDCLVSILLFIAVAVAVVACMAILGIFNQMSLNDSGSSSSSSNTSSSPSSTGGYICDYYKCSNYICAKASGNETCPCGGDYSSASCLYPSISNGHFKSNT